MSPFIVLLLAVARALSGHCITGDDSQSSKNIVCNVDKLPTPGTHTRPRPSTVTTRPDMALLFAVHLVSSVAKYDMAVARPTPW